MRFEIIDKDDLVLVLTKAGGKDGVKALKQGLHEEAQIIMRNSQKIVPVDSGTLRRSGQVNNPVEEGSRISVTLGYGGAAKAYALIQHENLFYSHKEGQQAKYLETPFNRQQPKIRENLIRRLRRILDKG